MHGEFGMMADGRVYLPPKPWAATVAVYDDGHVGMGSWPPPPGGSGGYDEAAATRQIPEDMVAMRQNLTSVVEDGVYNPWKRWWWGAAPQHAGEQTYIDRSGLCVTEEGFLAFFWGKSMGADALGAAMLAARCLRGLHLDMNSKHTGFEFYNVLPRPDDFVNTEPDEDDFQATMAVPDTNRYIARSRKAVRTMAMMRFPRYIRRDPRDFFYLTLRPVLPGPKLNVANQNIEFSTKGLPHRGWPHAFARACLKSHDGNCTWLLRVDPNRVLPQNSETSEGKDVLAFLTAPKREKHRRLALYVQKSKLGFGFQFGVGKLPDQAEALAYGDRLQSKDNSTSVAVGVDQDGFLVYAERHSQDKRPLAALFAAMGIREAISLNDEQRFVFSTKLGLAGLDGHASAIDENTEKKAFVALETGLAEVIFPDNTPLPYHRWAYAQGKRVRYFPEEHKPRFRAPGMEEKAEDAPKQADP
ncbi:MAG: hypothetical protein IPJ88_11775 [Myxococcales bacterium]|nr:MAG: hypothetical protein IPJ88_11775 [Myxococcales bacterium]